MIEVWNKLDRLEKGERAFLEADPANESFGADRGLGADGGGDRPAHDAIEEKLARGRALVDLTLDSADGQGLHWLYEHGEVMSRRDDEAAIHLTVRVAPDQVERVKRRFSTAASGSTHRL